MTTLLFCGALLAASSSAFDASENSRSTNEKRETFIANSNSNAAAKAVATPQDSDGAYLGNGLGGDDDAIHGSYGCEELQDVSIEVYVAHGLVEIEMRGPQGEWFGFGFGSYRMEGTYAIIAGEDCVNDYILSKATVSGDQADNRIDDALSPITVISDESDGFYRTIRIQRPRDHPDTFSFPSNIGNYPIISAKAAYQTHRVAYHGNNRRPDRIQFTRMYQHASQSQSYSASSESQQYSASSEETTRTPTARPTTSTTRAPTAKPTTRPTTAWPTEKPTAKPTYKPTTRPITPQPTAKPTHASCCVPAPGQGVNGYQHAGRNHENPLKCTEVYHQDDCERLMNSRGEFRCDWATGPDYCGYQELEAEQRDAAMAAEFAEAQRQKAQRERAEREEYEREMEAQAARLAEESRRTEEVKELDRQKHMRELEAEAKKEAEKFAKAVAAAEAAEQALKLLREQQAAKAAQEQAQAQVQQEEVWDGPSGECVWNGNEVGALKAQAITLDAECAPLSEMDCMALEHCAWVGFQHMHGQQKARGQESQLNALSGVDVRALLDMKVSTMDILLGAAVVITAAFALHQLCRWVGAQHSAKAMAGSDDYTPLLPNTV